MIVFGKKVDGSADVQLPVTNDGKAIPVEVVTGSGSGVAAGDGTANPTTGDTVAYIEGFNGTTWDRIRASITAIGSTFTGFLNSLPFAMFNTTPTTRTTGQGGPLEAMSDGSLRTTEQLAPNYEDQTNGVAKVEQRFSYTNITSATTTTVKSGAGFLHLIVVNTPVAAATITIYDNTTNSGTKIGTITLGGATVGTANDTSAPFVYDVSFTTGLTIVTSGSTDITISWR